MSTAVASHRPASNQVNIGELSETSLPLAEMPRPTFSSFKTEIAPETIDLINHASSLTQQHLENRTMPGSSQSVAEILPLQDMRLSVSIPKATEDFASMALRYYLAEEERPAVVVSVERNRGPWEIRAIITDRNLATDLYLKIPL